MAVLQQSRPWQIVPRRRHRRQPGHGLAAVHDRAAADSQNEIDVMFFGKLSPFENLGIGRIGHDTRKFDDILTGFGQDLMISS